MALKRALGELWRAYKAISDFEAFIAGREVMVRELQKTSECGEGFKEALKALESFRRFRVTFS